jgi:DNA-binding NtrC family response regulator
MLKLAPLRERGDDVITLAEFFARQTRRRYGLPACAISDDARAALRAYPWPGNIRELKHVVERALLLAGGAALSASDLMLPGAASRIEVAPAAPALAGMTLDAAEKALIEMALKRTGHNVSEAARQLGVTRMAMRYRMKAHGIDGG